MEQLGQLAAGLLCVTAGVLAAVFIDQLEQIYRELA